MNFLDLLERPLIQLRQCGELLGSHSAAGCLHDIVLGIGVPVALDRRRELRISSGSGLGNHRSGSGQLLVIVPDQVCEPRVLCSDLGLGDRGAFRFFAWKSLGDFVQNRRGLLCGLHRRAVLLHPGDIGGSDSAGGVSRGGSRSRQGGKEIGYAFVLARAID